MRVKRSLNLRAPPGQQDWRAKSTLIDHDFLLFYSNSLVCFSLSQETYTQHGIIYEDYQQSWEPRVSAEGVSTRSMRNKALSCILWVSRLV